MRFVCARCRYTVITENPGNVPWDCPCGGKMGEEALPISGYSWDTHRNKGKGAARNDFQAAPLGRMN